MVGIKHDRDALNVLYAHRQSHARTHASREAGGEEEKETTRDKKKPTLKGGISREGKGKKEDEKREREREKEETFTLFYLEATSGRRRRRLRATHGGNPCTPRRQLARTRTVCSIRTFDEGAHRYHTRMAAIESTREREKERPDRAAYRVGKEAGLRRDTNTRVHAHATRTRERTYVYADAYTRDHPGTARAKLTLT